MFDGTCPRAIGSAHNRQPGVHLRFIHISDVHLDTAFAGRPDRLRSRFRHASLEALARCAAAARDEEVDALLIAGDLFDGAFLSFETERFLLEQLGDLGRAGIQVVYATGNHDPGRGQRSSDLDWPGTVTVIARDDPVTVPVHGRGGDLVGHVTGAGHTTPRETADLSRRLVPAPGATAAQVALLHTQVSTASAHDVHHPYAPSKLDHLRAAGFHYWALGHVHLRQELSSDPPVHYCGNLQGRNPRETGPKGGLLVDLGDPARPLVEFREFAPVRWEKLEVASLADATTLDEIATEVERNWAEARAADPGGAGTEWMVAVELAGPSPIWRQLREPRELETIEDEVAARLDVVGAEVRAGGVHPQARVGEHIERRDVLGATLQLCRDVAGRAESLGLTDADLAGFDPERDGTVDAYLVRLLKGGGEEILDRMVEANGAAE